MAKDSKSIFFCQNCGYESAKWMGQCPVCREWNSFAEEVLTKKNTAKSGAARDAARGIQVKSVSEIPIGDENRIRTGIGELDRVLGGGIVLGSLILFGGDPGIGKSTLLLQVCRNLGEQNKTVLYVSGEESLAQIKMRAVRIGSFTETVKLLCETDLSLVEQTIERIRPDLVVIDSIQTMYNEEISSAPGSVSQVRESTAVLLRIAKTRQIPVCIVGHVTKDGNVAGPRVLEHMVDTVLYFEGERYESYRILRSVKNRFGSTNEIGVFEMRREGLAEVQNPSEFMLDGRPSASPGSVVACSMEGSRPILLEIQALVCRTNYGFPRRTANGTDYNRVNLLMAVLEKRGRINLSQYDAYINITGGIRMNEPALDLGILLAVASSYRDQPIGEDVVVFGEVGLSGEIRSVPMAEQRVKEAVKLGFHTVILPKGSMRSLRGFTAEQEKEKTTLRLIPVASIKEALQSLEQTAGQ
ncbi:MAG: DNA repair protein RadA [Eubacterium sp.]|nr:DNA repair protein RadA [Eubacterium sp.]